MLKMLLQIGFAVTVSRPLDQVYCEHMFFGEPHSLRSFQTDRIKVPSIVVDIYKIVV